MKLLQAVLAVAVALGGVIVPALHAGPQWALVARTVLQLVQALRVHDVHLMAHGWALEIAPGRTLHVDHGTFQTPVCFHDMLIWRFIARHLELPVVPGCSMTQSSTSWA